MFAIIKKGHFVLRWLDLNCLFSYCVKNHTCKQYGSIDVSVVTALATAARALAFAGEQDRSEVRGKASGQFVPGAHWCRAWHSPFLSLVCHQPHIN